MTVEPITSLDATVRRVRAAVHARARLAGLVGARTARQVRRLAGSDADRGSGAAAVLIFALVFMSLAAFVVDGGLSISKRERAADIAEQAARYAAEDIDIAALRSAPADTKPVINDGDCDQRVRDFARQSGLDVADATASHCTFAGQYRVEVTVQITYRPMLTGFFYDHDVVVHGSAAAESVTGDAG